MKYVVAAWALPLGLFWGWFYLSLNDINFGSIYLSRALHDLVFELYGNMLGVEPQTIPWLIAKACILDTGIILAIWAFRRRKQIGAWLRNLRQPDDRPMVSTTGAAGRVHPAE
ncbi:MAG: DUF6105 family protein [Mesorhizobium sp.]